MRLVLEPIAWSLAPGKCPVGIDLCPSLPCREDEGKTGAGPSVNKGSARQRAAHLFRGVVGSFLGARQPVV